MEYLEFIINIDTMTKMAIEYTCYASTCCGWGMIACSSLSLAYSGSWLSIGYCIPNLFVVGLKYTRYVKIQTRN